jgi:hypothetical protein
VELIDDLKTGPVALDIQVFIYFIDEEGILAVGETSL